MAVKKYRALLSDIRLRQSPDKASPKYGQWHVWRVGDVFTPPPHLKSIAGHAFPKDAIAAGYVEEVKGNG